MVSSLADQAIRGEPLTTVDDQHGAINKTRRVGADEHRRSLDIGDSSKATKRNVLPQPILDRLRHQAFHSFRVFDWARCDRVHADSITSPLDSKVARQRVNTRLRDRK